MALSYERRLPPTWAVQFQGGIPPKLTAVGAGAAEQVEAVAKARIWFPTLRPCTPSTAYQRCSPTSGWA